MRRPVCRIVNAVRLMTGTMLPPKAPKRILIVGARPMALKWMVKMMYRVLTIVSGAMALAACSSSPDWMNLDALKPSPILDTVRFESEPPGAEAKASNGQSCRTPCALALPINAPMTATFALNGFLPESETIEPVSATGSPTQFRPNPVTVELAAAPPQPAKKPAPKKKAAPSGKPAAKPAARPKPAAAAPSSGAATAAPAQQPAPWPSNPPPAR
jgi:hypothetical protein